MINKRTVLFFILIIIIACAMFIVMCFDKKGKKIVIEVDGFEVEYSETNREITIEDFDGIELGSSIYEISNKLGEPDTWIGSGMLRPVYFLKDNKIAVFYFRLPAVCEDLKQIVLISENGESQIIKEK